MGLELEVAGGPAPVNMVAVESFLMASGWQRNAEGKLAPMGSVGRAVASAPGQDRAPVMPTAAAGGSLRGRAAR